jgi:hypothetical protein
MRMNGFGKGIRQIYKYEMTGADDTDRSSDA